MALNKYMHPRNIYRTPPDFGNLSKRYPAFSAISKMDVTGKITIDFKDPHALRVLTKCLLKSDFNLDVDIPKDRLVPTLPLRLNYILWLEDLLDAVQRKDNIRGLDIGTGACAIYPLLAAVKNKWHFVGTETDAESFIKAKENVQNNCLQELIKLRRNSTKSLISHLFQQDDTEVFDFCMCNPPFYSTLQELCESRSPARLPPKNGFTGSPQELITEGGELEFCRQLIRESKEHKDNVLIFTTMVGHKYNLSVLLEDLKSEQIKHTHTEFCQGRVTRWGLAWTYKDYDLYNIAPPRDKSRKRQTPTIYLLPEVENCDNKMEGAQNKLKDIFDKLNITHKVLVKQGNCVTLDMIANENTWSNQRRKRRLQKRAEVLAKVPKLEPKKDITVNTLNSGNQKDIMSNSSNVPATSNVEECSSIVEPEKDILVNKSGNGNQIENVSKSSDVPATSKVEECSSSVDPEKDILVNNSANGNQIDNASKSSDVSATSIVEECSSSVDPEKDITVNKIANGNQIDNVSLDRPKSSEVYEDSINQEQLNNYDDHSDNSAHASESQPLVHAFFKLIKKDNNILLEVEYLNGNAGKEGLHQILQYIKNNWK